MKKTILRNAFAGSIFTILCGIIYATVYCMDGYTPIVAGNLIMIAGGGTSLFILHRRGAVKLAAAVLSTGIYLNILNSTLITGGISSTSLPWIIFLPIINVILSGIRAGMFWGGVSIITIFIMATLSALHKLPQAHPVSSMEMAFDLMGLTLTTGFLIHYYNSSSKHLVRKMRLSMLKAEISAIKMKNIAKKLETDIAKRKTVEKRLKESEKYYRSIFENSGSGIVFFGDDSVIESCNAEFGRFSGYDLKDIIGQKKWTHFVDTDDLERLKKFHDKRSRGALNIPSEYDFKARHRNGSLIYFNVKIGLIPGTDKRIASLTDITKRKTMEKELRKAHGELESIFENSQVGIMLLGDGRRLSKCNQKLADLFGYETPGELIGLGTSDFFISRESYTNFNKKYLLRLKEGEQIRTDYKLRKVDGDSVWCSLSGTCIDRGTPPDLNRGILWVVDDIKERKQAEFELRELAIRDGLTGLYNRRQFMNLATKEFRRTGRRGHDLSLLMVDADHFKRINDTYGHNTGDDVLKNIAGLGSRVIRDMDIFGRIGGEEFAVLLPETNRAQALEIARRLIESVEKSRIELRDGSFISCTISVGAASLDDRTSSMNDLMIKADSALYEAKRDGRNKVKA